jgi:hypothetical protein
MVNYSNLSNKLLKKNKKINIRPLKGLKLVIKGRLNGIRRTRKSIITHKGVSPNTISSNIKQYQLPINTK